MPDHPDETSSPEDWSIFRHVEVITQSSVLVCVCVCACTWEFLKTYNQNVCLAQGIWHNKEAIYQLVLQLMEITGTFLTRLHQKQTTTTPETQQRRILHNLQGTKRWRNTSSAPLVIHKFDNLHPSSGQLISIPNEINQFISIHKFP